MFILWSFYVCRREVVGRGHAFQPGGMSSISNEWGILISILGLDVCPLLLLGVCLVLSLPLQGQFRILECPLSPDNLLAHQTVGLLRSTAPSPYNVFKLLWLFGTISFSEHRNSITARFVWQTSSTGVILKKCEDSAKMGTGGVKFEYNQEG